MLAVGCMAPLLPSAEFRIRLREVAQVESATEKVRSAAPASMAHCLSQRSGLCILEDRRSEHVGVGVFKDLAAACRECLEGKRAQSSIEQCQCKINPSMQAH